MLHRRSNGVEDDEDAWRGLWLGLCHHPGLDRQIGYAPELSEVVRDQWYVPGQGVGRSPQIVRTDRLADGTKIRSELAVLSRDLRVEVDYLNGRQQVSQASAILLDATRPRNAPLQFSQYDD